MNMPMVVVVAAVVAASACIVALQSYVSLRVADASRDYLSRVEAVGLD